MYYICVDPQGRETSQDIAMAGDISPEGMLIETANPINTMDIRIQASTGDGKRVEIDGIVIYSMQVTEGGYRTGVGFHGSAEQKKDFMTSIILADEVDRGL